ncbi:MAG: NADPH:quinone reductase [Gammaproteobacteria bacterium]|nr:NADPH:quinone reductase [Gammaproteobacteria bacterium]MBI5614686.1 NADPH:quinone reductase [Gammaproteobacteria bacterium]
MRAIQAAAFGEPEVLKLLTVPDPVPGPGEVRVRLHAAGVNPADTYVRSGTYAFFKPPLPYTPGFDGAGTVEALGSGVTRLKVGERVYVAALLGKVCTGTYAEAVVCDADSVHPLAGALSFAQGAALGVPYATAYRALFQKAALKPAEAVLVHGASGGVGIAALQMARAHGARVIGTAGTEAGRRLVREQGAHHVLDHTAPDYLAAVAGLTEGRGVDVVIEMLANVNLEKDLGVLAKFGRVVVVGSRGAVEITPRLTMGRESSILGTALWNASAAEMADACAAIAAGAEAGVLNPVVGRELPLAEAPRAHVDVMKAGAHGKLVLVM